MASLINMMMENSKAKKPEVGMGVTKLMYSDREAYTVQRVISNMRVIITRDIAKRVDENGMSDAQAYEFESVPLEEGVPYKGCSNWILACNDNLSKENNCKHFMACGCCEGCEFYKRIKHTNGTTIRLHKDGCWYDASGSKYYMGARSEFYDYTF